MSMSLIYHAFGLHGYDYVRQEFVAGSLILHIRPKHKLIRCLECDSRHAFGGYKRTLDQDRTHWP